MQLIGSVKSQAGSPGAAFLGPRREGAGKLVARCADWLHRAPGLKNFAAPLSLLTLTPSLLLSSSLVLTSSLLQSAEGRGSTPVDRGAADHDCDGSVARGSRSFSVSAASAAAVLFNGIGANWELAKPSLIALPTRPAIILTCPASLRVRQAALLRTRPIDAWRGLGAPSSVTSLGLLLYLRSPFFLGGGCAAFAHQIQNCVRGCARGEPLAGFPMVPSSPSVLW